MTGPRRWWPGPSLLRRLLFALLWAFLLVWCALSGFDYVAFKQDAFDKQARHAAQALAVSLNGLGEAEAALAVRVTAALYNKSRRESGVDGVGELLFVLTDGASGRRLYASPALAGRAIPDATEPGRPVDLGGQGFWQVAQAVPQGQLRVFEPVIGETSMLRWIALSQLVPMMVAFPFVLLPLWLAVWSGLRPLREFSARVAARDPADVSGLGLDLRYAELRPLVNAFELLLDKARQGIARERAFVEDAAHELRTPLAVVTAQAHALDRAGDAPSRHDAKTALERAVGRASHLVHQLLTLARLEGAPKAQSANLVEVTRQVLIAAGPMAAQRGIEVSLESAERLDTRVDVESFFTIVDNLLRNALAYCPAGSRVELTLEASDEGVRLAVRDDGPGIAAQDAPRLFDRFHRGRGVQATGSGLGLAIVRQAAQALGGTVALAPGLGGRGAGFVVRLPVQGRGAAI